MRLLLTILSLWAITAFGQTNYTQISQRYNWLAGQFRALNIPGRGANDTTLATGQSTYSGAVLVDSVNNAMYYRSSGRWWLVGGNVDTSRWSRLKYVNAPLYLANDSTIELPQSSGISDGYLTAADWTRFNNAVLWKDTLTGTITPIGGSNVYIPSGISWISTRSLKVLRQSNNTFYDAVYVNPANESVAIGSQGLAERYVNGTASGNENTTVGQYAGGGLTSGGNNTFIGKSAGFNVTTGSNNILIGRNNLGVSTTSNLIRLGQGFWATGNNAAASIRAAIGRNISAGETEPTIYPSAVLSLNHDAAGFLMPRMSTVSKNAISSPATGLIVYDATLSQFSYYNGSTWVNIGTGGGSGGGIDTLYRQPGKDSIYWTKGGNTYQIKDSVGTGSGITTSASQLVVGTGPNTAAGNNRFTFDNTKTTITGDAVASTAETLLELKISDTNDMFSISNSTTTNSRFVPQFKGYSESNTATTPLFFIAESSVATGTGTTPLMIFDSRRTGAVANTRPLFSWRTFGTEYMNMSPAGLLGVNTSTPTSRLHVGGSVAMPITTVTSTTTLDATHYKILVDATSGAVTINLPAASSCAGRIYVIKKIDASANAVTIDGNSTDPIDGAPTQSIGTQWSSYTIQSNGTAWFIG